MMKKSRIVFMVMILSLVITAAFGGCTSKDGGNEGSQVTGTPAVKEDNTDTNDKQQVTSGADKDETEKTKVDEDGSESNEKSGIEASDKDENGNVNTDTDNNTDNTDNGSQDTESDGDGKTDYSVLVPAGATGEYKKKDLKSSFNPDKATKIELNGDSISVTGDGAEADGNKVTVSAKGTYLISGTLDDGQIIVNAGDDDDVRLILNGATVTCSNSSAIYAINADKVILTLVDGTVNTFTDSTDYVFANAEKEEPNAAIFTDCDLSINGNGTLNVTGNFRHAIRAKADIKITGGTLNLTAVEKGIKAKKTLSVMDGTISIKSGDDGINAGSVINIDGGNLIVSSEDDGIQSDEQVIVNGGVIDTVNCKKGFKAPVFTPNGGEIK